MNIFEMTASLNRDLVGIPRPLVPTRLDPERKSWFITAANEELDEFSEADTLAEEVDAIMDLMYFSAGRLYEMGIDPEPILAEIDCANMQKKPGKLSKRPGSKGFDLVKPPGWTPPDVEGIIAIQRRPKFIVIGHGRHGKDTVGEMLADDYGLSFKSSSMFCAEKVIWPLLSDADVVFDFARQMENRDVDADTIDRVVTKALTLDGAYGSAEQAYEDRSNHRELWFQAIAMYCTPADRLGKELLEQHDVYCGIRSKRELSGVVNSGVVDAVIWVDRSDHLPNEDPSSISVEPWMATHTLDNNGSLQDLEYNLKALMENFR